jgi:hypothetical protein
MADSSEQFFRSFPTRWSARWERNDPCRNRVAVIGSARRCFKSADRVPLAMSLPAARRHHWSGARVVPCISKADVNILEINKQAGLKSNAKAEVSVRALAQQNRKLGG